MNEKTGISREMSIRLSKAFGSSPKVWLGLQMRYDLAEAQKNGQDQRQEDHRPARDEWMKKQLLMAVVFSCFVEPAFAQFSGWVLWVHEETSVEYANGRTRRSDTWSVSDAFEQI